MLKLLVIDSANPGASLQYPPGPTQLFCLDHGAPAPLRSLKVLAGEESILIAVDLLACTFTVTADLSVLISSVNITHRLTHLPFITFVGLTSAEMEMIAAFISSESL